MMTMRIKHPGYHLDLNGELKSRTKFTLVTEDEMLELTEDFGYYVEGEPIELDIDGDVFYSGSSDLNYPKGFKCKGSGYYPTFDMTSREEAEALFHLDAIREAFNQVDFIPMTAFKDIQVNSLPDSFDVSLEAGLILAREEVTTSSSPVVFRYNGGIELLLPTNWTGDTKNRFSQLHTIERYSEMFHIGKVKMITLDTTDFIVRLKVDE